MKQLLFSPQTEGIEEVHIEEPCAALKMSWQIKKKLKEIHRDEQIIILCIGTDRSTGDSLGPLIGTSLTSYGPKKVKILGTLKNPVHALNLQEIHQNILQEYEKPFIIAIDACLGKMKNIGIVRTKNGPLKPGAGVKKELNPVGDMNITGIVNVSGCLEYMVLQNTRLYLVHQMAKTISRALVWGINSYWI